MTFALGAASDQMGLEGGELIAIQRPYGIYVCLCQPYLMVRFDLPVAAVPRKAMCPLEAPSVARFHRALVRQELGCAYFFYESSVTYRCLDCVPW